VLDHEVGMVEVHAGVDHGHVHAAGGMDLRRGRGPEPAHAEGHRVAGCQGHRVERVHLPVGSDQRDLGVVLERPDVRVRQLRREASHRPLEAQVRVEAERALASGRLAVHAALGHGVRTRGAVRDHVSIAGRGLRSGVLGGRARGRRERRERKESEQQWSAAFPHAYLIDKYGARP
jgi:hypothetical protein